MLDIVVADVNFVAGLANVSVDVEFNDVTVGDFLVLILHIAVEFVVHAGELEVYCSSGEGEFNCIGVHEVVVNLPVAILVDLDAVETCLVNLFHNEVVSGVDSLVVSIFDPTLLIFAF